MISYSQGKSNRLDDYFECLFSAEMESFGPYKRRKRPGIDEKRNPSSFEPPLSRRKLQWTLPGSNLLFLSKLDLCRSIRQRLCEHKYFVDCVNDLNDMLAVTVKQILSIYGMIVLWQIWRNWKCFLLVYVGTSNSWSVVWHSLLIEMCLECSSAQTTCGGV